MLSPHRKNYVTASEFAAVVGKSPYKKAYEVYLEKTGHVEPFAGNEHTQRGVKYEPKIISGVRTHYFPVATIESESKLYTSPSFPFLAATPDGIIRGDEYATLEVKCPAKPWSAPPKHYVMQVYVQMLSAEAAVGYLAYSCAPCENRPVIYRYTREMLDYEYASMLPIAERFLQCVKNRILTPEFW